VNRHLPFVGKATVKCAFILKDHYKPIRPFGLSGAYPPQAGEKCKPMPVNTVATVITAQTSSVKSRQRAQWQSQ